MLTSLYLTTPIIALWGITGISSTALAADFEEVIVTAHKREQPLHRLPASIQVLSSDDLQQKRIRSTDEILDHLVNVSRNASNDINAGFTIRGVGTNNFHGNVNRSVGVYVDETAIANPYSGTLSSFDLERIEVLRGPQNVFFGRNSNAGAIHLITKKPVIGNDSDNYIQLTAGSQALRGLTGAFGIDTGKQSALRVAALYSDQQGAFTNLAQERKNWGAQTRQALRVGWLWQASEASELHINLHYGNTDGTNIGNRTVGLRDPNLPSAPCDTAIVERASNFEHLADCVDAAGDNPSTDQWHQLYNVSGGQQMVQFDGASAHYQYDTEDITFTSVTGQQFTEVRLAEDLGGSSSLRFIAFQDSEFDQWSQEFRVSSNDEATLQWQLGVSYFYEHTEQGTQVRRAMIANNLPTTSHNLLNQKDRDLSLFGQINWQLTEQLALNVGGRYTDNRKRADSLFAVVLTPESAYPTQDFIGRDLVRELIGDSPGQCPPPVGGLPCTLALKGLEQQLHEFAPSFSLNYTIDDKKLIYISYAEGFKAGGFDTRALAAFAGTADQPVGPEYLKSVELGSKFFWPGKGLRVNTALFSYQWRDQQVFDVASGLPQFVNIPKSDLQGAELDVSWKVNHQLQLNASLGWLNTEITDNGALQSVDTGHRLTNTPKWSATLGMEHTINNRYGDFTVGLNSQFLDKQINSLNFDEDRYATKDSQLYVDTYLSWTITSQYHAKLWGKNLTEQKTCRQIAVIDRPGSASPSDLLSTLPCNPNQGVTSYGIDLTVTFN